MTSLQFFSKSIDEEEGVIDGNADANERDDVGCVNGDVGYVGQPDGHADGGKHGPHSDANGQQRRHDGAEHDAEDQDGQRPGDQLGFDEVFFDAVVEGPIHGDAVGSPTLERGADGHRVVKIVHQGFRFFPVGAERDFVDGVGPVFVLRDNVLSVDSANLPGILDNDIRMRLKIGES